MKNNLKVWLITILGILVFVLSFFIYREFYFKSKLTTLIQEHNQEKNELQDLISEKQRTLDEINAILTDTQKTVQEKEDDLNSLNKKLKKLDNEVEELEKIIETDKELLQKYSKVYFLNENYSPRKLVDLDPEYKIDQSKEIQIHIDVEEFLTDLIDDAKEDGVEIRVVSGYRSFETQAGLKNGYLVKYGTGANTFSADQGYSEHQLGTTVDFSNPTLGPSLTTTFDQSKSFAWLRENAHRYGFILSYPKGNKYYQYEPWHWRFVGTDLARKLHRENINFYDLDQREINEYLGEIFD